MINQLRQPIAPLRAALARPLARWGIHPNSITLAAIPLSSAAALCSSQGWQAATLVLALAAAATDFLDGEVARLQQRTSLFGNYLEAVVDRWVDGVLLLGFLPNHGLAAGLAIILGGMVSYSKARLGLVITTDNSDWPGIGDRSDRLALLLLALVLGPSSSWTGLVLWLLVAVTALGCCQRVAHGHQLIRQQKAS